MTKATTTPLSPSDSALSRVLARTPIRLTLFIIVGVWFLGVWLAEPNMFGLRGHDWTYFTHNAAVGWRSVVQYGQLPQWNPYYCGGIPALGNVQVDSLAPDFGLTFIFGLRAGLRLRLLLMIVLGMEGTYRYARHHDATALASVAGALLFATSGRFVQTFVDGQPAFFGFELLPWLLLGLERAYERPRWAVLGGAALAWIFLHGGAIATPCCVVVAGLIATRDTLLCLIAPPRGEPRKRHAWRPYRALILVGLLMAGFTAIRLLPVGESLLSHSRVWHADEGYPAEHVLGMFFHAPTLSGYSDPGTSYVGLAVLVALGLGLLARDKKAFVYAVTFLLLLDLAMGQAGPLRLWRLVHALPVLKDFRNPFRFTFVGGLFLALGAVRGIHVLERGLVSERFQRLWARGAERLRVLGGLARPVVVTVVTFAAAFLVTCDGVGGNRARLAAIPRRDMGLWADGPFRQSLGDRWFASLWPSMNLGSIGCFEEQPFPTTKRLRGDLPQEEYFAHDEGTVARLGWSPHEIDLAIETATGDRLLINQNWHRGWSSDVGEVVSEEGLLAVDVPAGKYDMTVTFNDPLVAVGGTVSGVSVLGAIGFLVWLRRRDRREHAKKSASTPSGPLE